MPILFTTWSLFDVRFLIFDIVLDTSVCVHIWSCTWVANFLFSLRGKVLPVSHWLCTIYWIRQKTTEKWKPSTIKHNRSIDNLFCLVTSFMLPWQQRFWCISILCIILVDYAGKVLSISYKVIKNMSFEGNGGRQTYGRTTCGHNNSPWVYA